MAHVRCLQIAQRTIAALKLALEGTSRRCLVRGKATHEQLVWLLSSNAHALTQALSSGTAHAPAPVEAARCRPAPTTALRQPATVQQMNTTSRYEVSAYANMRTHSAVSHSEKHASNHESCYRRRHSEVSKRTFGTASGSPCVVCQCLPQCLCLYSFSSSNFLPSRSLKAFNVKCLREA